MTTRPKFGTLKTWMAFSGMGRTTSYTWLGQGRLRAIKVGNRTLVDIEHGLGVLDALPRAEIRVGRPRKAAASDPFAP